MEAATIISKLIDKISNYQFLNNIIPGSFFCVALPYITKYNLLQEENIWYNLLIIYIVGISVSRFGSLVVEELYKAIHVVKFENHDRYAKAVEKAPFIKTLSMENNIFRTFVAIFILLLLAKFSDWLSSVWAFWSLNFSWILCLLLLILFSFAYYKQTKYIVKYIKEQLDEGEEQKQ